MPKFEIEANGQRFEVEAPDQQSAMEAFQRFQQPGQQERLISPEAWQNLPEAQREALSGMGARPSPAAPQTEALDYGENPNDRGSALDPIMQGATFGWGDEARGLVQGGMAAARGGNFEQARQFAEGQSRSRLENYRQDHPVASTALEVGGAIPTAALGGGAAAAGRGATLMGRAATGGAAGMGQGAAYGAGAANGGAADRLTGAATGAAVGGAVGGAAPFVGNWVGNALRNRAQRGMLSKAARDLVDSTNMRGAASQMFDQVDQSGAAVSGSRFTSMLDDLNQFFQRNRAHDRLDPKALGALDVMRQVGDELAEGAVDGVPLSDLHNLRQIAQKAAMSSEGRDAMFANSIVKRIDDLAASLKPADMVGAQGDDAGRVLLEGISAWNRANKVGIIEEAVERAQNQASGFENGLRTQFRRILNNRNLSRKFNESERKAIEEVVQGTNTSNLMKLMGKFGFDFGNSSNMMGGAITGLGTTAATGNPLFGLAAMGAGSMARKQSENLTNRAAQRALASVATPDLQLPPPVDPSRAPALEAAMRRISVPAAGQASRVGR